MKCYTVPNFKVITSELKFKELTSKVVSYIREEHLLSFQHTCNYMFEKVRAGVFVHVINGKLITYQMFVNQQYNGTNVKTYNLKTIKKKMDVIQTTILKKRKRAMIQTKKKWGVGYCMLNNLRNWWKNNYYVHVYHDMLTYCLHGTDITTCFFLNLYDFPVLYNKKCDHYVHHEEKCSKNTTQEYHYIPVLSASVTSNHYDKCMINADSWLIDSNKTYSNFCMNSYKNLSSVNTEWDTKKNSLFFRGANSSCYPNDNEKNVRIKTLSVLNNLKTRLEIDVGFSSITAKPIVNIDETLTISDYKQFKLVDKVSMPEQSNNKYILDVDGYVNPWRLSYELKYNSCIIIVESKYKSWFYDKLEHMKNIYIVKEPSKEEFTKCFDMLTDDVSKQIASGSVKLYNKIMNKQYMKQYMIQLLSSNEFNIIKN